jgi:hypothetical protein
MRRNCPPERSPPLLPSLPAPQFLTEQLAAISDKPAPSSGGEAQEEEEEEAAGKGKKGKGGKRKGGKAAAANGSKRQKKDAEAAAPSGASTTKVGGRRDGLGDGAILRPWAWRMAGSTPAAMRPMQSPPARVA